MSVPYILFDVMVILARIYMKVNAWLWPVREATTTFDVRIRCDLRDFIQRRIYYFGIYEPNLTNFTIGWLREGDVVADLGANIGYFSLLASRRVGDGGAVFAIEASPQTFGQLVTNIERNGAKNVVPYNIAASSQTGKVSIKHLDPTNIGKNCISVERDGDISTVDGKPILEILGCNLFDVSFFKIDVEGSEGPILEDILERIDQLRDDLIIAVELSESNAGFVDRFRAAGFSTYGLSNDYDMRHYMIHELIRKREKCHPILVPTKKFSTEFSDYLFARRLYEKDSGEMLFQRHQVSCADSERSF